MINQRIEQIAPATVIEMRRSGASLGQIAGSIGRSKERVRQILLQNTGSTKHRLISTQQLSRKFGLSRNCIIEMYKDGIIQPQAEWTTGNHHYLLWSEDTTEKINRYYHTHCLCKICGRPLRKGRWVYCSDECYREGQKYKHKTDTAKQKHLKNIRGYMERRRGLVLAGSV
jgi:hypothetical protein